MHTTHYKGMDRYYSPKIVCNRALPAFDVHMNIGAMTGEPHHGLTRWTLTCWSNRMQHLVLGGILTLVTRKRTIMFTLRMTRFHAHLLTSKAIFTGRDKIRSINNNMAAS
jgi:uncharacterized membrane protein